MICEIFIIKNFHLLPHADFNRRFRTVPRLSRQLEVEQLIREGKIVINVQQNVTQIQQVHTEVNKMLKGIGKGLDTARKVAKTYNKFAQWIPGLPVVPGALLKE